MTFRRGILRGRTRCICRSRRSIRRVARWGAGDGLYAGWKAEFGWGVWGGTGGGVEGDVPERVVDLLRRGEAGVDPHVECGAVPGGRWSGYVGIKFGFEAGDEGVFIDQVRLG